MAGRKIFDYKGYRIKWSGWKQVPFRDELLCHWIAYSAAKDDYIVSPHPGPLAHTRPGMSIDYSRQSHQVLIHLHSGMEVRNRMRSCARELIKLVIDYEERYGGVKIGRERLQEMCARAYSETGYAIEERKVPDMPQGA